MDGSPIDQWIREIKGQADADRVGMFLAHQGVVRGTSRSGEAVSGMVLAVDRDRLREAVAEAEALPGVIAVRAWVNEGRLAVGDDIMKVLVAGDIREHVFDALRQLVGVIKGEVVSETETA